MDNKPIYIDNSSFPPKEKKDTNHLIYQTLMGITAILSNVNHKVDGLESQIEGGAPKNYGMPLNQKYSLSVEEAADYFGIGVRRLRALAYEHRGEDFIMEIGTHIRFKRVLFEDFLNKTSTL